MGYKKSFYLLVIVAITASCSNRNSIQYTDFFGHSNNLIALESDEVVLLYPEYVYDREILRELLTTYDKAYILAGKISGRFPSSNSVYENKLPLSIVPTTCGSGCGKLGMKGIEFTESKFNEIYHLFVDSVKHNHLFFYELGRNFWFYEEALTLADNPDSNYLRTGFAIFLRNVLIKELNLNVGEINGLPYKQYMELNQIMWKRIVEEKKSENISSILLEKNNALNQKSILWSMYWWSKYEQEQYSIEFLVEYLNQLQIHKKPQTINDLIFNLEDSYEKAVEQV